MNRLRAAVAAVLLCGCAASSLEPLSLSISVTATPTSAAVGDTITFVTNMQGDNLIAVEGDYGDGTSPDGFDIPFGRTARNTFKHVYTTTGSFTATFTAAQADSTARSTTATVQIH
jgi:hypothetical protein